MSHAILVVEDTDLLRRMYTDRLTQDGYRVLSAADGLEALSLLRNETPDLILLDLIMPKVGGLEVLERLQNDARLKGILVLVLSNLGQEEDIQRCMELGACDYLIKNDARPADISAKIKSVLRAADAKSEGTVYHLQLRDRELAADRFVTDAQLTRRFWCPACEVELALELTPMPDVQGHYDAHIVCLMCGREY